MYSLKLVIIMRYELVFPNKIKFADKEVVFPNEKEWELQTFDHIASIIDLTKEFKEKGWGLKVPFAYDPGGWHFCLSFDKETYGQIIINRWTDHSPEEQFVVIADSFEEFINGLKQADELS